MSIPPSSLSAEVPHRPGEGDWVEVAFKGDDGAVDAWWEGQVVKTKGDFAYVNFPSVGGLKPQEVVEVDRLRPARGHAPARLEKRHFPLSTAQLKAGASIISKQLGKISKLAGLLRLAVTPDANDMIAIGTNGALETGTALINMMLLKVPHMVAAEARAIAMQSRAVHVGGPMQSPYETLTFFVDTKALGLLHGPRGAPVWMAGCAAASAGLALGVGAGINARGT